MKGVTVYCYNCGKKWKLSNKAYAYLRQKEGALPHGISLLFLLDRMLQCCDHPQILYGPFPLTKVRKGKYRKIMLKDVLKGIVIKRI